jgi:uncharacterized protein (TIGR02285 family)
VIPPPQFVISRKTWREKFKQAPELSLEELLKNKTLRPGFAINRSYSDDLDKILSKYLVKPRDYLNQSVEGSSTIINMVGRGDVDYAVEYPLVAEYQVLNKQAIGDLVSIPIKEAPKPREVYVACTKNAWGKKIITSVDKVMQNLILDENFRNNYESWFSKTLLDKYRADINQFYKTRSSGSMIIKE